MKTLTKKSYQDLVETLETLIQDSRELAFKTFNQIRLQTYWKMGCEIQNANPPLPQTQRKIFLDTLADDLNLNRPLLSRIHNFYLAWPDGLPASKNKIPLTWAHHIELLPIKNSKQRQKFFNQAIKQGLTRNELRSLIKQHKASKTKNQNSENLTPLSRKNSSLHIYKAKLERVVDGDTLLVNIDLGFDVWAKERLRLRGIDVVETKNNPKKAEKVKRFVEKELGKVDFFVIQTTKTDIFGRYVADIFYHPKLKNEDAVQKKGFFLNQILLEKRYAIKI